TSAILPSSLPIMFFLTFFQYSFGSVTVVEGLSCRSFFRILSVAMSECEMLCPIGRGSVHGPAPQSPSKGRGRLRRRLLPADRRGQRDVPVRPAIHVPLEASRPVHDLGHRLESYEFHRRVAVCGLHRGALTFASGWSRLPPSAQDHRVPVACVCFAVSCDRDGLEGFRQLSAWRFGSPWLTRFACRQCARACPPPACRSDS